MPMIVLPVERLIKPKRGGRGVFITEDAELIDGAGIPIRCVFDEGAKLADAPFYHPGWARVAKHKQFPVGRGWPRQASAMFDDRVTVDRAAETTAWKFITDLRNALSHGAINYLDGDGRSTDGHAAMLGFASTVSETDERLNLMRITQLDFLDFLRRWAIWCGESGVRYELDRLSLAA